MPRIERAILSCYDKTGLTELAGMLCELGVEIIATTGTQRALEEAGIPSVSIADFTGVQEMMDGRVKSLHYKIHAGLLGLRDNKLHLEQSQAYDCKWIDLVVVNLHPLPVLAQDTQMLPDEMVEQIDIGGVSMIRSAAKNFRYVTVIVNPERYAGVVHELRAHEGEISFATRYRLAVEAFECTANYDGRIAAYLEKMKPEEE